MFIFLKNFLLIFSFTIINACSFSNLELDNPSLISNVNIETSFNKNNVLFKEHLKRVFKSQKSISNKYLLKASISYTSSTLAVSDFTTTKAIVSFSLFEIETNKLIKSGTIQSSSTIGSTSNSLYANDINFKHVKERLNISIAKKLHRHIIIIVQRLK